MKGRTLLILTAFVLLGITQAQAAEKTRISVSGQPVFAGVPTWENERSGAFAKTNLDVKFRIFPSGAAQIEAFAAKQWDVGTLGTIPTMLAGIRYGALVIGIPSDDSDTNAIYVRPDSPILKTKGYNPEYPDIYGKPEDWRGKKILCTTMSNGHYVLTSTLKALGLTEKDVNIIQIEQGQAIAAFNAGQGDVVQLFAPGMYVGEAKGWKQVASGKSAKVVIAGSITVNKDYAEKNPEAVVEWLDLYMKVVEGMSKDKELALNLLNAYFNDYCSLNMDKKTIETDYGRRGFLNVEQQLAALTDPAKMRAWMTSVADFMFSGKRISEKDLQKYKDANCYIEPKFMKMVAEKRAREAAGKQ